MGFITMKLPILTWTDFKKYKPCYDPKERYGDFLGTILDILKNERIPAGDRIWAATRDGIIDYTILQSFVLCCESEIGHLYTNSYLLKAVEIAKLNLNDSIIIDLFIKTLSKALPIRSKISVMLFPARSVGDFLEMSDYFYEVDNDIELYNIKQVSILIDIIEAKIA